MDGIPVIPKCKSIIFDSGNILTWSRIKKRPPPFGSEEVLDSFGCLTRKWISQQDLRQLQYVETLHVHCPKLDLQRQVLEDREDLRVYVKLTVWLDAYRRGAVNEAVHNALKSLGSGDCDGVVLSIASRQPLVLEDVKPLWFELEELRSHDLVGSLGVADFPLELLEELHGWAAEKPRICQVSEKLACGAPQQLRSFAAANGLQLLTHSDPPDPLPAGRLSDVLGGAFGPADGAGWRPSWLARVTASYRHRGVVSSWGFVAKVERRA